MVPSTLLPLLLDSHPLLPGPHPPCSFVHLDQHAVPWSYNLSALASESGDYEVHPAGRKIVMNVCRPPISACRPAGEPPRRGTPTAIVFWGPPPAPTSRCGLAPCTQNCALLGWGALGGLRSQWSLIDPFLPAEGIRLTHYGLMASENAPVAPPPRCNSCCNASTATINHTVAAAVPPANWPTPAASTTEGWPVPPVDEWGQPRPPLLVVDLICDPAATSTSLTSLESVTILGQQRADTALRLRTAHACPTRHMPAAAAATPTAATSSPPSSSSAAAAPDGTGGVDDDGAGDGSDDEEGEGVADDEAAATAANGNKKKSGEGGGGGVWQTLLSMIAAVLMVGVLFMGFAPLALRKAVYSSAYGTDPHGLLEADEDEGIGRYRGL